MTTLISGASALCLTLLLTTPVLAAKPKPPADPATACLKAPTVECLFIAAYTAAAGVAEADRRGVVVDILGQQLVAGYAAVPREVVDSAALTDAELAAIMRAQLLAGDGTGALASAARIADPAARSLAQVEAGLSLLKRGDRANAEVALAAVIAAPTPDSAGDAAILAAGLGKGDAADDLIDRVTEKGKAEEARHGVARRLAEQDRLEDALDIAGDIRFSPGRDATLAAIADVRAGRDDLDGALTALDEIKDPSLAAGERARLIPALLAVKRFDEAKEVIDRLEGARQQAALIRWAAASAAAGNADALALLNDRADAVLSIRTPADRFEAVLPLVGAFGRLEQRDRALALGSVAINAARAIEPPAAAAAAIRRLFAEQAQSGERIGLEATLKALSTLDDDPSATLLAQIDAGQTLARAGDRPGGLALLNAAGSLVERLAVTQRSLVLARLAQARVAVGDTAGAKAALIKGTGHLDALRQGEGKAVATLKLAEAAAALKENAAITLATTAAVAAADSNWPARTLILADGLPILLDAGALGPLLDVHLALPAVERPKTLGPVLALIRRAIESRRPAEAQTALKRLTDPAEAAAAVTVMVVSETRAGRTAAAAKLITAITDPAERARLLSAMAVAMTGR